MYLMGNDGITLQNMFGCKINKIPLGAVLSGSTQFA